MSEVPMIKIFSLTDVESPELKAAGMVGATIAVHDKLVGPGESTEVADTDLIRAQLAGYTVHKAIAVGQLPSDYVVRKTRLVAELAAAGGQKVVPASGEIEAPTPTKRTGKRGADE